MKIINIRLCISKWIVATVLFHFHGDSMFTEALSSDFMLNDAGSGDGERIGLPSTCTEEFANEEHHTMCLEDSPNVVSSGVTVKQKKIIVDYHNKVRREVQPSGSDLTTLVWDDNLAVVAEKLAKQCVMEHDENRDIPWYGMGIGQNLAAGYRTWIRAMTGWFDEVKLYRYGEDADVYLGAGGWTQIGHYTQMVSNQTHRVGCGFARCRQTEYGYYYACNYAGGQSSWRYPYTLGKRCAACPHSCKNGICDCSGKLCLNGGKLDIDTCTCKCPDLYKGDDCSEINCPKTDGWYCGGQFQPLDCDVYWNVPLMCPYMCGLCGVESAGPTKPPVSRTTQKVKPTKTTAAVAKTSPASRTTQSPGGFVSEHNCTHTGRRSSPDQCKSYGDHGGDKSFCQSMGGQLGCSDCDRYLNVGTDYCPVMCGLCDAPCGGKKCFNNGNLNKTYCQCECIPPYHGTDCSEFLCPERDEEHCMFYSYDFCNIYKNVPEECPYLCQICKDKTMNSTPIGTI